MENGNEVWKDVVGYEGIFMVSSWGNVKSFSKILNQAFTGKGYKMVCLNGFPKTVHRLVAIAFIPNPENKKTVNHKDGNKANNYLNNLDWATYSENQQHAYDTGLIDRKGAKNPKAKLSEFEVLEIKKMIANGGRNIEIALKFSCTQATVSSIKTKRIWKQI